MPHKDYLEFTYESLDALVGILSSRGSLWANVTEEISEEVVAHAKKQGLEMRHRVIWSYSFGPCGGDNVLKSDRVLEGQVARCPKYPSQLPERYLQQIIRACTDEESFVLTPFLGRGEICIAARALGRRFIGIDVNEARVMAVTDRLDLADIYRNKISNNEASYPD